MLNLRYFLEKVVCTLGSIRTTDATVLLQFLLCVSRDFLFALLNVHDCFGSFYIFLIESTEHYHQIHFESTGSMWVSRYLCWIRTQNRHLPKTLSIRNCFIFWQYWWLIRIFAPLHVMFRGGVWKKICTNCIVRIHTKSPPSKIVFS